MKPVRPISSARSGLLEWLVQRVSAIYLAGFGLYLAIHFAWAAPGDFVAWRAWFGHGTVRLAWALFFTGLLLHAWTGMRSVYLDYLHPLWLRFGVTLLTAVLLLAAGLWAAQILLRVAP